MESSDQRIQVRSRAENHRHSLSFLRRWPGMVGKLQELLEDFKHEIDETREAERYKFGDGGTLVSSIRVTAPVLVAGKKGRIVFSVVPSKHLPLLIGRDFLTPARAVVDMGEKTLRIGTGVWSWAELDTCRCG